MLELLALALVPVILDRHAKNQQQEREKRLEQLPDLPYRLLPFVQEMEDADSDRLEREDVSVFRRGNRMIEVTTNTTFRITAP
ncbi:MAG: hypothetical protein HY520_01390 [Candidatus Aenigmarchaeota archaeon]|nr:hypothetical protein [Candidatus Aenigmarchaeota archaeon]